MYPIASFTWIVVPAHIADDGKRAAMAQFLEWMLGPGRRSRPRWDMLNCRGNWRRREEAAIEKMKWAELSERIMSAAPSMVSIGDQGVLNHELAQPLADVWIDRDLGWLDFNDRVLAEALDERTPLLERAKFLAIFTFQPGRVLHEANGSAARRLRARSATQLLASDSRDGCSRSLRRQARLLSQAARSRAGRHGIHLRRWDDLTAAQQDEAGALLRREISPALTPLVFDPAHPFPFLSNLSTSLAFLLFDPAGGRDVLRAGESALGVEAVDSAGDGVAAGERSWFRCTK